MKVNIEVIFIIQVTEKENDHLYMWQLFLKNNEISSSK